MNWTRLSALIIKELLAAFRDPRARFALILPPVMQFFLFAFAATLEITNVPIGVVNQDWGTASTQLMARFERASAFSEIRRYSSIAEAQAAIDRQDVMVVVQIGQEFSRELATGKTPKIQVLLDGRKSNGAQIVNGYISSIVGQFGADYKLGSVIAPVKRDRRAQLVQSEPKLPNRDDTDFDRIIDNVQRADDRWHVSGT